MVVVYNIAMNSSDKLQISERMIVLNKVIHLQKFISIIDLHRHICNLECE